MTRAEELESRMRAHKMFYFEVFVPWHSAGNMFYSCHNDKKLMQVEATCKVDAIIRVLKQLGMEVSEKNSECVTEITKEQYDIAMLDKRIGNLNFENHRIVERLISIKYMAVAGLTVGITSTVLSIGILIAASLVANGTI